MRMMVLGAAMVLGLAGCAGPGPEPQESSASGIELYWYAGQGGIDQARREAQDHCRSWGKEAELLQEFTDRDVTRARFACR